MLIAGTKLDELAQELKAAGYKKIAINQGAVQAYPKRIETSLPKQENWPAMWAALRKCGIGVSCGNSHQAQFGKKLTDMDIYHKAAKFYPELNALFQWNAFPGDAFNGPLGMIIDLENYKPIDASTIQTLFGDKT